jgi:hypothetical protein
VQGALAAVVASRLRDYDRNRLVDDQQLALYGQQWSREYLAQVRKTLQRGGKLDETPRVPPESDGISTSSSRLEELLLQRAVPEAHAPDVLLRETMQSPGQRRGGARPSNT